MPKLSTPQVRAWRLENPERNKAHQQKYREAIRQRSNKYYAANREKKMWDARQKKYGISAVEFAQLLLNQEGMCGLCGKSLPDNFSKIAVDHNHDTGKVRSLLHFSCNIAIGMYELHGLELKQYLVTHGEN